MCEKHKVRFTKKRIGDVYLDLVKLSNDKYKNNDQKTEIELYTL